MRILGKRKFYVDLDAVAEQRVINNRANVLDTVVEASRGVFTGLLPEELMAKVATLQELERMKQRRRAVHKHAMAERIAKRAAKRAAKRYS